MGSNGINGANSTRPNLPWSHALYNWSPFKIDALGLVTLLGAEEINMCLGRLVPSRYLEYFPLLGAYVIAGERFKEKLPSFNLYNVTDGINTSDLSCWLTRWMLQQEFEVTRSIVQFDMMDEPRPWKKWYIVSAGLSCVFIGFLIVMTILIGDWYGLANAVAMTCTVLTRAHSLQAHRNAIDRAVVKATADAREKNWPTDSMKTCIVVMSNSKAVTLLIPGHLLVPIFSSNPEPSHPIVYNVIRYFGWAVFAVHIVTIGMAQLLPQMYTVALMVLPTVLICFKFGCDDAQWKDRFDHVVWGKSLHDHVYRCWIGTRVRATIFEWPTDVEFEYRAVHGDLDGKPRWTRHPPGTVMEPHERSKRRQDLYAWLNLTAEEELSLAKWDLLPHVRNGNESWWQTYQAKKALITERPQILARMRTESTTTVVRPGLGGGVGGGHDGSTSEQGGHHASYHIGSPTASSPEVSTTGFAGSPFALPARTSTLLTANGFVVPSNSIAGGFFSAGMGAAGVGLNTGRLSAQRTSSSQDRRAGGGGGGGGGGSSDVGGG